MVHKFKINELKHTFDLAFCFESNVLNVESLELFLLFLSILLLRLCLMFNTSGLGFIGLEATFGIIGLSDLSVVTI